jgi:hypothetical protein
MTTPSDLRARLHEIAGLASTAAEALDAGRVDFLPPEVARLLGALDGVSERLADIWERLAAGVDPKERHRGARRSLPWNVHEPRQAANAARVGVGKPSGARDAAEGKRLDGVRPSPEDKTLGRGRKHPEEKPVAGMVFSRAARPFCR